jgi:hypothetical protein
MAGDALSPIIAQIQAIPATETEADFLIISNGGDPITALRIVSCLRERFEKFSVLIPYVAYSAATLLSLGSDDIVMHPFSNLGPVDPQFNILKNLEEQTSVWFSPEDIKHYLEFLHSDVGITEQAYLSSALVPLTSILNPLEIGFAKRGYHLSLSASVKLLKTHMLDNERIESIAMALNESYYHHGYPISRKEAINIGLKITKPNSQLESIMWDIWLDYCDEMKCDTAFDIAEEVMNYLQSKQFVSNDVVGNFADNTPPDIPAQTSTYSAGQNTETVQSTQIEIPNLIGSIESSRLAYACEHKFIIKHMLNTDSVPELDIISDSSVWKRLDTSRRHL